MCIAQCRVLEDDLSIIWEKNSEIMWSDVYVLKKIAATETWYSSVTLTSRLCTFWSIRLITYSSALAVKIEEDNQVDWVFNTVDSGSV
jgi:alpha-N-acetylglucosamine transferase